jgi:hypothetical protein
MMISSRRACPCAGIGVGSPLTASFVPSLALRAKNPEAAVIRIITMRSEILIK